MINKIDDSQVHSYSKIFNFQNDPSQSKSLNTSKNKSEDSLHISKNSYLLTNNSAVSDLKEFNIPGKELDKLFKLMDEVDSIINKGINSKLTDDEKKELKTIEDRLTKIDDQISTSSSPEKLLKAESELFEKLDKILGENNSNILTKEEQSKIETLENKISGILDKYLPEDDFEINETDMDNFLLTKTEEDALDKNFNEIDLIIENAIKKNLSKKEQEELKNLENRLGEIGSKIEKEGETKDLLNQEDEILNKIEQLVGKDYGSILSEDDRKKINALEEKNNKILDTASARNEKAGSVENQKETQKINSKNISGNSKDYNVIKSGNSVIIINKQSPASSRKSFPIPVKLKFYDKAVSYK